MAAIIGGVSRDDDRLRMFETPPGLVLLELATDLLILSQIQAFRADAANGLIILIMWEGIVS